MELAELSNNGFVFCMPVCSWYS